MRHSRVNFAVTESRDSIPMHLINPGVLSHTVWDTLGWKGAFKQEQCALWRLPGLSICSAEQSSPNPVYNTQQGPCYLKTRSPKRVQRSIYRLVKERGVKAEQAGTPQQSSFTKAGSPQRFGYSDIFFSQACGCCGRDTYPWVSREEYGFWSQT